MISEIFRFLIISMIMISFIAVPSIPTGPLEITDVQRTNVSIKWKVPADDGGAPITGYNIEKKHAKATLWTRIEQVSASTLKMTIHGLYEKNEYYFRVLAVNRIGQSVPLESSHAVLARSPFGKYFCNLKTFKN